MVKTSPRRNPSSLELRCRQKHDHVLLKSSIRRPMVKVRRQFCKRKKLTCFAVMDDIMARNQNDRFSPCFMTKLRVELKYAGAIWRITSNFEVEQSQPSTCHPRIGLALF